MAFDVQPTLRGELVTLRPLRPEDFDELYAVASDPLVWAQHPEPNRFERPVFEAFFRTALESGGAFAAIETQSGCTIGSSRFHGYDAARSEVEIGWTFLARSYWGGRYNGEMKRSMLEHAFGYVENVVFVIGAQNRRSRRAVEKLGGILVGSRPASPYARVVYRITRTEMRLRDGA